MKFQRGTKRTKVDFHFFDSLSSLDDDARLDLPRDFPPRQTVVDDFHIKSRIGPLKEKNQFS